MTSKPGILHVFDLDPKAAVLYRDLAQLLLRRESRLTVAEREAVAAYISECNGTEFCEKSHLAACHASGMDSSEERMMQLIDCARILHYRLHLLKGFKSTSSLTSEEKIEIAQIVAAFEMYNSLVDSLNPRTELSDEEYKAMGEELVTKGYKEDQVPSTKNEQVLKLEELVSKLAGGLKASQDWLLPHPHAEGAVARHKLNDALHREAVEVLKEYELD